MGGWYDYATNTHYTNPQSSVAFQSAADGTPLGTTMFYEEPSWTADGRVLLFDSLNGGVPQAVVGGVGTNHNDVAGWFHDLDTFREPDGWKPVGAGELSRSGTRLAALRAGGTMGAGYEARGRFNRIQLYTVSGLDRAPVPACELRDSDGRRARRRRAGRRAATRSRGGRPRASTRHRSGRRARASSRSWSIPGGREPDWGRPSPEQRRRSRPRPRNRRGRSPPRRRSCA